MKKTDKVLEVVEKKISFKTSEKFDPKEYYQNRKGLYIWSSFQEKILPKAKTVKKGVEFAIASFKLAKWATDEEIESALPKKHIFKEGDVCALISEMIAKQPEGQGGALLNTGYANLFYTKVFVVSVDWFDVEWDVSTWGRGGRGWFGDNRVFSPVN